MDAPEPKIVTLASLRRPVPVAESMELEPAASSRTRAAEALYGRIVRALQDATDDVGANVLVTVRDPEVSRAQSRIAELASESVRSPSGGLEVQFGTGLAGADWFRWLWSLSDWVSRADAHPLVRPSDPVPEVLADDLAVALAADWATGLYGAPRSAAAIRSIAVTRPFDLLMHLGDVYYSGTPEEVEERFLRLWPADAGLRNRALNGNHDMYSGGFGYFGTILPAFGQAGSYFALQNEHWLLVGLDTAYVDHDIDDTQLAWLDGLLDQAGPRKTVLFSHQQPFSRLSSQGLKLQAALRPLLERGAITAWYWGHEHQCVVYDRHDRWGFYGRCLGNGGVPEPRPVAVREAPLDGHHLGVGQHVWRRLDATANAPGCVVLDGPNLDMAKPKHQRRFGPHGFLTLEFVGPRLVERVHLSDGTQLLTHVID